jgi:hypothetical protein
MLEATTFPRPTDSALSRHYDEVIDAKAEECLTNEHKMARLEADYAVFKHSQHTTPDVVTDTVVIPNMQHHTIPEDSMLRRHFLTELRAMIEKNKGAYPTDSTLHRHYTAMINAELENTLNQ